MTQSHDLPKGAAIEPELPRLPEPLIWRHNFPAFQAKIAMNCYSAVQMDQRWREGYEAGQRAAIAAHVAKPAGEPMPSLYPVIQWLENGCNPKEAAKELRLYEEARLQASAAAWRAAPTQSAGEVASENDLQIAFKVIANELAAAQLEISRLRNLASMASTQGEAQGAVAADRDRWVRIADDEMQRAARAGDEAERLRVALRLQRTRLADISNARSRRSGLISDAIEEIGIALNAAPATLPTTPKAAEPAPSEWKTPPASWRLIAKAALNLLYAIDENHDKKSPPHKYAVPYGVVNDLRSALGAANPSANEINELAVKNESRPAASEGAAPLAVPEDTRLLDWLETKVCECMSMKLYGSKRKAVFGLEVWGDTEPMFEGFTLRDAIRAAIAAAPQPAPEEPKVKPQQTKDQS